MRKVKMRKVKMPKLPKLIRNPNIVCNGLHNGIHCGITSRHALRSNLINDIEPNNLLNAVLGDKENKNEKPVTGAGKGGKVYGQKTSRDFDGGIKIVRQKNKEIKPYKPIPQMHEIISIEEIQRKCGIRKPRY